MWCWNACLQRALSKYGIEKSQKEIIRGIAKKYWVSPFESKRRTGNAYNITKEEFESKVPSFIKFFFSVVFNDDINSYIKNITNGRYIYQTVTIPRELYCSNVKISTAEKSKKLYSIISALRNKIAEKQNMEVKNVILITACPLLTSAHAVTIEDTVGNFYVIGEPAGGVTVTLPYDKFFSYPSDKQVPFILSRAANKVGFNINFIIECNNRIIDSEWQNILNIFRVDNSN